MVSGSSGFGKRPVSSPMVSAPAGEVVMIRNKIKRNEVYQRMKAERKKQASKERRERQKQHVKLGDAAPPKAVPKTQESTRERDETMVDPADKEVIADQEMDEFALYFNASVKPKIAITTCRKPSGRMFDFISDLLRAVPKSSFYERRNFEIKQITSEAVEKGFTDIIIINEDRKELNGLVLIHLPDGPTAHFKLTNVRLSSEIAGHGVMTGHDPEVVLNNFNTRLGTRIGRMFAALFDQRPEFTGRRAVTFHNQRDFIFFRQHRYIFDDAGKIVNLQELGPQFTLKLKSLQAGTFDSVNGEYEWKHRQEMDTSRRRFFL
ncbi:Brix domain-containing protein [Plasmodiophora brassicae]